MNSSLQQISIKIEPLCGKEKPKYYARNLEIKPSEGQVVIR